MPRQSPSSVKNNFDHIKKIENFITRRSKLFLILFSCLMIVLIGYTDYLTGYELSFSIFYLVPILLVSWFVGGSAGYMTSVLSAAAWLYANISSKHVYSNPVIPFWNMFVRLGFFLIIVTISHLLSDRKKKEELLNQQTKELVRSNAELEQFAAVASHDLQSPLRVITSFLQLLEQRSKGKLNPEEINFIAHAVSATDRMRRLITDLLEYAHVGKKEKDFKPLDCNKVLNTTLFNLAVLIEENNAKVTSTQLPMVMAIESELIRLFQNLIGNAIKYKSENNPEIHISAQRNRGEWLFSMRDNGIGIDSEHFDRIFQIFQRLHAEEKYSGTGIGLAICKKIVEFHGGQIWVESERGKGSAFYFTIPEKSLL